MAVTIHIENPSGADDVPGSSTMRGWIRAALTQQGLSDAELSVRIVDAGEMAALNHQYRHRNYATNVLSFPADLPAELDIPLLGDIAVCAPVVAAEAVEQGKAPAAHWAHMLVHGTLHLLGHDHMDDGDAVAMEATETLILTQLGFPPPYEEHPVTLEGNHR